MSQPTTRRRPLRELVLVGGGHSHVQLLRRFAMKPPPDTHLSVVVDRPIAIYSGMVPGFVAGQYRVEELEIDVVPLARRAQARVILSAATRIDAAEHRIHLEGRPSIHYDIAAIDIGSTVAGLDLPGVRDNALPTRPISSLVRRVDALVRRVEGRDRTKPFRVVIVGGGAGGIELAFTLWQRLGAGAEPRISIDIIHAGPEILEGYPDSLIRRVRQNANKRSIGIECSRRVVEADEEKVVFRDGATKPCDALIWVSGATAHPMARLSGLPADERGFLRTLPTLQVEGHPDLFAVGDCATLTDYPRTPKAGVYAVRQGPYLIDNLLAALSGRPLKTYRPQSDFLTLLNLGDGTALGTKWGLAFEGRAVMRLKDWIDRRFMEKFQVISAEGALAEGYRDAPDMSADTPMLCGGCAAKVGQSVLERSLARLPVQDPDPSVVLGLDTPDDAAAFRTREGDTVVVSLDAFRAFIDDPYIVGRIAAINAISDLYATGAEPKHALALIAAPNDLTEDQTEELIYQLMSGAREVFDPLRISLLGGHTITAPELMIGFTIDGVPVGGLMKKSGLSAGDALVVTKGLGTGVILHADMQGRAKGLWLAGCLDSMGRSNNEAARIARVHSVTALTDITGFGLAGHLAEMVRASRCSARVFVDRLPALEGSEALLAQGFRSTFHEENAKSKKGIRIHRKAQSHPKLELAFDPQTSGGLIMGIPSANADRLVSALGEVGEVATIIGEVGREESDVGTPLEMTLESLSGEPNENDRKRRAVEISSG